MPMTNISSPSSGADRASRYRKRKREGRLIAPVEVLPEDLKALVDNALLEPGKSGDRAAIGEAIECVLLALSEGAVASPQGMRPEPGLPYR